MALKKLQIDSVQFSGGFATVAADVGTDEASVQTAFRFKIDGDGELDALVTTIGEVVSKKIRAAFGEETKPKIEVVS